MRGKPILGVAVVIIGLAAGGMTLLPQVIPAAGHGSPQEDVKAQKGAKEKQVISVDVVIEDVDLSANTITARATHHVIPPGGQVGGAIFSMGTTDSTHNEKATRFIRLPVMPAANLKIKRVRAGLHAILQLEVLRQGPLVVVGIEPFRGAEKVGVEWLDATGTEDGKQPPPRKP